MCLGTFSRRARSLATCFCFARVRILAERFLFHRTHFPMKQKTRLLCFQRRRAIFTRVTTSVHLCLAAQTSTGTFIPYRYNRRNLSQPRHIHTSVRLSKAIFHVFPSASSQHIFYRSFSVGLLYVYSLYHRVFLY